MQNKPHRTAGFSMTSRERVLKSIRHEEPDRLPIDLGGMASTGIMAIAYARLKEHLGINGETRVFDMGQQLAEVEPEILSRFGVDVVSLGNSLGEAPPEFWKPWRLPNGAACQVSAGIDLRPDEENGGWLIWENEIPTQRMSASSLYFSEAIHPLAEMTTPEELKLVPRPVISDEDLKFLEMRAKALNKNTDFAIIGNYGGSVLEAGNTLRGFARFMMDLGKGGTFLEDLIGGMVSAFLAAVLLAVGPRFILGASGADFARAATYAVPLFIRGAIQYPSWVGDNVQLGSNKPYLKSTLVTGEQIIRVILALVLLQRFQVTQLVFINNLISTI